MEKKVILDSPVNIELSCSLARTSPDPATIEVTWEKDNETIKVSNVTFTEAKSVWNTQYM